jgi:hypothetical protein
MQDVESFATRRPAGSGQPTFQLSPPDLSQLSKYKASGSWDTAQRAPAAAGSSLTSLFNTSSSGLNPEPSSLNRESSGSSTAGNPPYVPVGPPSYPSASFSSPQMLLPSDQPDLRRSASDHSPSRLYGWNGPIMSNVHRPGGQMSTAGGMSMQYPPYQIGGPAYGHHLIQQQRQSDRPFKCNQCSQGFNRKHDLTRHMRIHLAVKPFPCGYCEKSFSRKDALKVRSPETPNEITMLSAELELSCGNRGISFSKAAGKLR